MSAMSFMELCLTPLLFSFLSKHPASESKAGLGCMACWFLPPFASCREQVCPCTVWEGGSPETDLSLCFYRKVPTIQANNTNEWESCMGKKMVNCDFKDI